MRRISNKDFVYGEIDFLSFCTILERAEPQGGDVFYDLGSGSGKAVFTAALFFDLSKAYGIELLPLLYTKAIAQLKKATVLFQNIKTGVEESYLKQVATIQFIHHNFLDYDFADANIIYVAATCFTDSTWEKLIHKMAGLKSGTRIIVATKNIQHERFEVMYQGTELMSWGLCPVTIYVIKA